jgi:hypothetical protein
MSLPTGSKSISSIDNSNYNYLTGDNSAVVGWNAARSSFVGKGKPSANLDTEPITLEDIELINSKLPEGNKDYVFANNGVFAGENVVSDLRFTDPPNDQNEHTVQVTFIDEGAGYKNSLGYFFYVEIEGTIHLLDNADDNTDNSAGYYRPTVIFPNASSIAGGFLRSDGVLLPGHRRTLKGNLANGKFQNVNIGFFLVPNGWDNRDVSTSIGVRYDNKAILHTTSKMNPNYVPGAIGAANHGYQSVLFNRNSGESYVVGFEDIQRPSGDGDFNDLIFRITTDPVVNLANTATVGTTSPVSECLQKTKQGLVLVAPISMFPNLADPGVTYRFDRTITFNTTFDRDRYLEIYTGGYLTFSQPTTYVSSGSLDIVVTYTFTSADINENTVGDNVQLYLLRTDDNRDDETVVDPTNPDPNERTPFDKLVLMQRLENDNVDHEDYAVTEIDSELTETTLKTETNMVPYNTVQSALIWGDPHIKTIRGEVITLADDVGWRLYFESKQLLVRVFLALHPEHPMEAYQNFSFIREVEITDKRTGETVSFDTFDPSLPWRSNRSQLKAIKVGRPSETDNKKLRNKYLSLLSFDPEVKCQLVNWRDAVNLWIIFYPTQTEFFNEIFVDKSDLIKIIGKDSRGLIL